MKIEELTAYEVIERRDIADLNSIGYIVRHKKTGAKITLLSNDDENKVFYIGFKTPPTDSTGVPHIIEHTVLCGSKKFPVKDPFIELAKGSLNTFLNAMTYPDKTVYPVASYNTKDFQNLMDVYLDAVFYPNIYREEKIFKQEGWHYDLESPDDKLTYNGVVYNEMKGAFSSPDDVLDREVYNTLFPDTAYGVESGGDPEVIPTLTYEQFLDFHRKYYHPSNSYIYLYGDMDMAEKLKFIDEEYLSKFDRLSIDSSIGLQKSFKTPIEVTREYPIMENEATQDNTYLSYNAVVGTNLDKELYLAFQILDYALCSAPGAPLKQALIDKKIGKEVYSIYENGIYQPYFSIVAKGANTIQKQEFIDTIESVLRNLVKDGIDKKSLLAGLNYYEFKYREADFGSYPKGLMYGLQALDSWLYDENEPFMHIEENATFALLKERISSNYYELLIQTHLLENTHKAIIVVEPVKGLTTRKDKELADKLEAYKEALTKDEIERLVTETQELLKYQEAPSSKEALQTIPLLTRADMKKEAEEFINVEKKVGGTVLLTHPIFTNGIGYIRFVFSMDQIPVELMPYAGLLKSVLGYLDTKHYSYGDLFNEINIKTGGISSSINTYTNAKNLKEFKTTFEVKIKVLYQNLNDAFELLKEILFTSKLDDFKRIKEILEEAESRMQANMMSAGHSLAAIRAMSYFSGAASISERVSGLPVYRLLEKLTADYEEQKDDLAEKLTLLCKMIFRPENLMVDYTASEDEMAGVSDQIEDLKKNLYTEPVKKEPLHIEFKKLNEGLENSAQVQYVCRAGNFINHGLKYTGAFRVLKVIMGYDYLWNNVRVKGGAYGCMSNFGKSGDAYMVSYRDPNLSKTIEVYEKTPEYLRGFKVDERAMTKFIIGAISEMDVPLTPSAKGTRSMSAYLSNQTFEEVQKERDELLQTKQEDIRKLAGHVEAMLSDECICVVGNADKIEGEKELFLNTEQLFH